MGELRKFKYPGRACVEFMVKTKCPMNEPALREAALHLVDRYENLRVKLYEKDGRRVQEVYPARESGVYAFHDLSNDVREVQLDTLKRICIKERDWLLPGMGNVIRVLFFKLAGNEGRIWFCMHHCISDFLSLITASGEFLASYNTLSEGKELKRMPSYDYRKWAYVLAGYVHDVLLPREFDYWVSLPWERAACLPTDYPDEFPDERSIHESIDRRKLVDRYHPLTHKIDSNDTAALIARYGRDFEILLIAVYFLAMAEEMAVDCLDISASWSGRNLLPPEYGINESKLIGFISGARAMLLSRAGHREILQEIPAVMRQIKEIPGQGTAFNLICDHIDDPSLQTIFSQLRKRPQIFFNYLGRTSTESNNERYEIVNEDTGLAECTHEIRNSILECMAGITQGQLYLTITYIEGYTKQSTAAGILRLMATMLQDVLVQETV